MELDAALAGYNARIEAARALSSILVDINEMRDPLYFAYFAAYQVGGFSKSEIARACAQKRRDGKPYGSSQLNTVSRAINEVSKLIGLEPRSDRRCRGVTSERKDKIRQLENALKNYPLSAR